MCQLKIILYWLVSKEAISALDNLISVIYHLLRYLVGVYLSNKQADFISPVSKIDLITQLRIVASCQSRYCLSGIYGRTHGALVITRARRQNFHCRWEEVVPRQRSNHPRFITLIEYGRIGPCVDLIT